jgi:hypothetical protein
MPTPQDELNLVLPALRRMPEAFYNSYPEHQATTLRLLKFYATMFTQAWRFETNLMCPEGWDMCADGSCKPPGTCPEPEPITFGDLLPYLHRMPEDFFRKAGNDTIKQLRTVELLKLFIVNFTLAWKGETRLRCEDVTSWYTIGDNSCRYRG